MLVHPPKRQSPGPYLWTQDEFHQMWDLGWFIDKQVELVHGEIIEMPQPGPEHDYSTHRVTKYLESVFGSTAWIRAQMALDLSPISVPGPDVAAVPGVPEDYRSVKPKTAFIVVEVSDSTLAYDRHTKASLYAAAGIPEYWIVNLVNRQLEVHREPRPDPKAKHGSSYADCLVLKPNDHAAPLTHPQAQIPVAELLP